MEAPGVFYRGYRVFIRMAEIGDADLFASWSADFFLLVIDPGSPGY